MSASHLRRHCTPSLLFGVFQRSFSAVAGNKLASLSVFAWGSGNYGVLGQGNLITSDSFEPVDVPGLPPDIMGVGAGSFHSLAWTSTGQLFTWGRNKEWQLGRSLAPHELDCSVAPAPVPQLEAHSIVSATGSGVATFAITDQGQLLVAGTSKRGQLGLGPDQNQAKEFTPVPLPLKNGKVTSVAAGWGHTVALVEDGRETRVFSWGWPANGRLGHSFASSIEEESEEALYSRCVYEPREIELLRGVKITSVACGMDTTYCITQDGRLISFGDNSLGQLGRPERENGEHTAPSDASCWEVRIKRQSEPSKYVKFRRLAAGLGHVVALAGNGNLVSWGWNGASQLGLGERPGESSEIVLEPQFIFGVAQNRQSLLAAGRVHSVLITDDIAHERTATPTACGRSWPCLTMCHTWGSAANGRLGTGTYEDAPFPELLPSLDGEMFVDVACGMDHTLALIGREGEAGGPLTAIKK